MFMGPFEYGAPWDSKGILGMERFLKRCWSYLCTALVPIPTNIAPRLDRGAVGDAEFEKRRGMAAIQAKALLHKTIKKVGEDIESFKFNTAISALMILLNHLEEAPVLVAEDREALMKLIHPFAPHMAQELSVAHGPRNLSRF